MSCHYFKYYHWFNFFTPNQRKSALLFLLCREFSSKIPRFIIIFVKLTLADSVIWSYINEGSIFLVILFSSSPPPNFFYRNNRSRYKKWVESRETCQFILITIYSEMLIHYLKVLSFGIVHVWRQPRGEEVRVPSLFDFFCICFLLM